MRILLVANIMVFTGLAVALIFLNAPNEFRLIQDLTPAAWGIIICFLMAGANAIVLIVEGEYL